MTETVMTETVVTETVVTETVAGPSGQGTVVLDLGAGVGALVLHTPAGLDGREIEISRDGDPGASGPTAAGRPGVPRTHSRVRPRHVAAGTRYAAVYPGLPEGRYTIWAGPRDPAGSVVIEGGRVTTWNWPG
jgi:hypothetical protein